MALLYALLDGEQAIDACHLSAARAVVDYAGASGRFIFAFRAFSNPLTQRIGDMLREAQGEWVNRSRLFVDGRITATDMDTAIAELHASGKVECAERLGPQNRRIRLYRWGA